ncbi:MAG: hypothetical protein Q9165_006724 [Trypethelium subeluteriae]
MPHFGDDSYVVLPPTKMHELLQKSDAEVDAHIVLNERIQATYTVGDDISIDNFHFDIVRRHLTRSLPLLVEPIYEELALAFKDKWSVAQDGWTSIKVLSTCTKIVARVASRVFTGVELCKQYSENPKRKYSDPDFQVETMSLWNMRGYTRKVLFGQLQRSSFSLCGFARFWGPSLPSPTGKILLFTKNMQCRSLETDFR